MNTEAIITLVLIILLVVAAAWSVSTVRILRSAIGLALTSAILAVIMYRLGSPWAAAFELSVGAGLISVIFISTINLTQRLTSTRYHAREMELLKRFWVLPVIIILVAVYLSQVDLSAFLPVPRPAAPVTGDVRTLLWFERHLDIIGQIAVILAGAFSVVLLFKERKND